MLQKVQLYEQLELPILYFFSYLILIVILQEINPGFNILI